MVQKLTVNTSFPPTKMKLSLAVQEMTQSKAVVVTIQLKVKLEET